jgi:hypothetical protein
MFPLSWLLPRKRGDLVSPLRMRRAPADRRQWMKIPQLSE